MYIKMFKMAGSKTHSVLITYRMPKEGPILQELRSSCNVQQHTGPDDFMPREDLIKALNNVDAALIQSEDVFDRDLLERAGKDTSVTHMSHGMGFPTMWYVRPAKPQISLRICAV